MNRLIVLISVLILLLSSCKVTDQSNCNLSDYKDLEIELGYLSQSSISEFYQLKGNKITNSYNKDTIVLDENVACNLLQKSTQLFLKIQTLNVPADSNHYMIYKNKKNNADLRALWNPIHDNKGNLEFKSLYKEYMDIIKSKEAK